jgi:hypothetical protein
VKTPRNSDVIGMHMGFPVMQAEIRYVSPGYVGVGGRLAAILHFCFAPIGMAIGLSRVCKLSRHSSRHHPASLTKYPD